MARARLPDAIPGPFFVLRYDKEREVMSILMSETESHAIGEVVTADGGLQFNPTAASHQLQRWGVDKFVANDAIDQALEFRSVQVIPREKRVINLIRRGSNVRDDLLAQAFAIHDERPKQYAYI